MTTERNAQGVGVLAVFEEIATRTNPFGDPTVAAEHYERARAAVAELVEAAAKLRADVYLWRLTGNMPNLSMLAADEERLDAALARVQGGEA